MIYFVSGIDTDIGKTYATGLLARYLLDKGKNVATQKIVQTGNKGFSEDIQTHRKIMGCGELPEDKEGLTCPYLFKFPASPHYSAEREHKEIKPEVINKATRTLQSRYEALFVEAAGGLCVPLNQDYLTIDYFADHKFPLFLVTSGRLGSINHTILSLEAIVRRRIPLAGLIFNRYPASNLEIVEDTRRVLLVALERLGLPQKIVDIPEVNLEEGKLKVPDFSIFFEE